MGSNKKHACYSQGEQYRGSELKNNNDIVIKEKTALLITCSFNVQVISETLRMASIISFTFREAVADVEYKGKIIGKEIIKIISLFPF